MPGFNLESFKANFTGGARSYLFYYLPRFPGGIAIGGMNEEKVTYLVRATSLPENTLEEGMVQWQGFDFKFATKHTYTDFTVTFNVDRKAQIRALFEAWINKIHNPETNVFAPLAEYLIDQRIQLLDYDGTAIQTYTLYNTWVKTVGPVTLDYSATDVAQFDVTFTYSHHAVTTP